MTSHGCIGNPCWICFPSRDAEVSALRQRAEAAERERDEAVREWKGVLTDLDAAATRNAENKGRADAAESRAADLEREKAAGEFWRGVFKDGADSEDVRKELADFHFAMEQVPLVYDHITGGALSKINYYAKGVIATADRHIEERIAEAVKDATEEATENLESAESRAARAEALLREVQGPLARFADYCNRGVSHCADNNTTGGLWEASRRIDAFLSSAAPAAAPRDGAGEVKVDPMYACGVCGHEGSVGVLLTSGRYGCAKCWNEVHSINRLSDALADGDASKGVSSNEDGSAVHREDPGSTPGTPANHAIRARGDANATPREVDHEACIKAVCWACREGLPMDEQHSTYHDPGRDSDGNMRGLIECRAAAIRARGAGKGE